MEDVRSAWKSKLEKREDARLVVESGDAGDVEAAEVFGDDGLNAVRRRRRDCRGWRGWNCILKVLMISRSGRAPWGLGVKLLIDRFASSWCRADRDQVVKDKICGLFVFAARSARVRQKRRPSEHEARSSLARSRMRESDA